MKKLAIGLYAAVTVALMVWAFTRPSMSRRRTDHARSPAHLLLPCPSAMVAFLFFAISLAGSICFLAFRRSRAQWAQISDAWALAGAEVGVVFCTVVLITGPIWGRRAWGIWWTWDARLTTTLVLWLIYVSYLLLRRFAAGPQVQTLAAVLGIFGRSTCRSSICRTAGGAHSIRPRFLAVTPTRASRIPQCWLPLAGMSSPGLPGACSFLAFDITSSAGSRGSPPRKHRTPSTPESTLEPASEGQTNGSTSDSRSPVHRRRLRHHLGHPAWLCRLARV